MKVVPRPPSRPSRRRPATLLVVAVVLLMLLGGMASFYTEVLWFEESGYDDVFWTGVRTRLLLGAGFGTAFALLLLLNLWVARKITSASRLFNLSDAVLERYRAMLQPYTKRAVIGACVVFGLFAGSGASVMWQEWLLSRNDVSFGQVEPVFNQDIGFYVFQLPFQRFVFTWLFSSLVVITIATGLVHYFLGGIRPQGRPGDRVSPEVRAHLSVLLGLIVLVKAWGYRLDQFRLMLSDRGVVTGASYTDVNAELPALRLLVVIAIVCAVLFVLNAWLKNWIMPIGGIGLLALTSLIAGGIYPAAIQRLRVEPNEGTREAPYIARNIEFTRRAFGIDKVQSRPFKPNGPLTAKIARANPETMQNIRLWEPQVLGDAYLQLQRIKQYYEFLDVDVDRYRIGDELRQVMLSPREIAPEDLAPSARTWVNEHLVYTHGYGAVASRVDRADADGRPSFIVHDLPPESVPGAPAITQPRIYYGENEAAPFSIVDTKENELDYPQSAESGAFATTKYAGRGGVALNSLTRRAAFAWRFRDPNILISGALTDRSKILFRRQISQRVSRVAPFLKVDYDPYIVLAGGRLVWMLDAYTTTDAYPYAQRIDLGAATAEHLSGRANYIRNAVKFVIDAEHGSIDAYLWDEADPVIKAWAKIFPDMFKPRSAMPPELLEHVRYPEDMFRVQSERFAGYHVTNPSTFYSNEDAWSVAIDPNSEETDLYREVPPYYLLLKPPGEEDVAFTLVRPFTPNRRPNLSGYLMAHGDPDRYGELISYELPESDVEPSPQQARSRIEGDSEIAPQLNLLQQGGSKLIYGNLLVVPVEDRLLYVQPMYLTGGTTRLPELKRVAIVTGARVVMADSLAGALRAAVGGETGVIGSEEPAEATLVELLNRALAADREAQQALRRGDFAAYGARMAELRENLQQAAREAGVTPSPSPTPTG